MLGVVLGLVWGSTAVERVIGAFGWSAFVSVVLFLVWIIKEMVSVMFVVLR